MSKKQTYTPRALMELAIEVMRRSVPEPRTDGKASPKVGAVLVKPDGTVETAFRGELRYGDHAEFTLFEWLATRDSVTTAEYQEAMRLPERTARNHLKKLTELGLLMMVGAGRATRYEVVRK